MKTWIIAILSLLLFGCKGESADYQKLIGNFPEISLPLSFKGTSFPDGKEFSDTELAKITEAFRMEAIGRYSKSPATFLIVKAQRKGKDFFENESIEWERSGLWLFAYEHGTLVDKFQIKRDAGQEPFMNDVEIEENSITLRDFWFQWTPRGDSVTEVLPEMVYKYSDGKFSEKE
ncbi:MAG: hypothetical protein H6581_08005 [Bacteroidia bacterium]|nr:hypothetical protein [Bacteroidia bacterium]